MSDSQRSYAVLGAGALGLTVALRLAERGNPVTVYERDPLPGGLAAGFRLGSAHLEKFYHHLFRTDRRAVALVKELGLGDRLEWISPRTVVLRDGRLWPLDSASSVLRFQPIPLIDRVRLGAAVAYLKLSPNGERFEGRTAASWIRTSMGDSVYETVWEPLLSSKFGTRHEDIALPWFWARIHFRTAALGYLRGGFQQLYDSLMRRVVGLGSTVELATEVVRISGSEPKGFNVETTTATYRHDRIISTLPTRVTARLAAELPDAFVDRYTAVDAYGAMCLILGLNRPLTDAYWININDAGFPFQPAVEHTNFVSPADYEGRHIVYLGNYLPMEHRYFQLAAEEMLSEFLPGIRKLNPDFERAWVRDLWLFKAPFAQPIVTTTYRDSIPPHTTPVSGLYMANMFQVYPQDRGQNYSIAMAEKLVQSLI
jgi:protoporphyrinogen oxidase